MFEKNECGFGDPVKWKGYLNATPLHAACKNSHLEIVKILIEKGADIKAK
jgi:ankyrin repeat protein